MPVTASTIAEQIVHQALLQLAQQIVQAGTSLPAASVHVERLAPVSADECPAVVLSWDQIQLRTIGTTGPFNERALLQAEAMLDVRVHTRGDPHTELAGPTLQAVHRALMAEWVTDGQAWPVSVALETARPTATPADGTAGTWQHLYRITAAVRGDDLTLAID